ncbi:hypothetical protein [Methylobacterium crusticola]|uniref:hypothetical protein n=1 Tax=Methylobacterium crusticola TaxID=1697972 RepID=UPI000FFC810A|nr:hypothetical protein [Methylobacterium crusticola]
MEVAVLAEAAGFTAGCVVIHAARRSARGLTPLLATLAAALALGLCMALAVDRTADPALLADVLTGAAAAF